jgi:hypothetical protein
MVLTYSSGRPGIAYDRARIAGEACERIYNSFAGAKPTQYFVEVTLGVNSHHLAPQWPAGFSWPDRWVCTVWR